MKPISYLIFFIYALSSSMALPTIALSKQNATIEADTTPLIHPHIITIERLETLLRRAGEIFRPAMMPTMAPAQITAAAFPNQQLQPPTAQPYNFYLPLFEHAEDAKLDEKSRSMEKFTPPPPPSNNRQEPNYYASKPKKTPKKFNAAEKLVNIKWLNAFEREALADSNGLIPKAMYLANDEQNRINFDDSFFAVDMLVPTPADNNPHKATETGEQDFLNQGEEGEDLIAVPAAHIPLIGYGYNDEKKQA